MEELPLSDVQLKRNGWVINLIDFKEVIRMRTEILLFCRSNSMKRADTRQHPEATTKARPVSGLMIS